MAPIIRELSKSMINKIAAGEVVERPANVVKELVENSIDAGATRVEVEVETGGIDCIKVTDNGCGIPPEQLVLALSPHSTSKLYEPDDLFRIHTLGFRGEALASIAEISHLVLTSRSSDSHEGAQIRSDGGAQSPIIPVGRAVGTTIEVRDLFFNVPARRKFLKSKATEFGHVQEAIVRLAIPNTDVAFVLKHAGRTVYDLPANEGMKDRIRRIFKDSVADRLVHVEMTYNEIEIEGYVGLPDLSRSSSALQYLFLNKRYIRDNSLLHAVTEAYRGTQLVQRYPAAMLKVTVPPNFVDVNVHPTKMEVRFVDQQGVYAGLLGAIRSKFLRTDILYSRPNGEELAGARDRSIAQNAAKPVQLDPARSPAPATPATSAAPAAPQTPPKSEEPLHEPRLVLDVDPSDPRLALDNRAVANSRRAVTNYFDDIKSARDGAKQAEAEGKDSVPADSEQAKRDVQVAEDALAEAAKIDAQAGAEQGNKRELPKIQIKRRDSFVPPVPGQSEFRKFPPLPEQSGSAPEAPISVVSPKTLARQSEPVKAPTSDAPQKTNDAQTPAPQPQTVAPEQKAAPKSAEPASPSLLDLVSANNAHILSSGKPLGDQIPRNSKGLPVLQMCNRYLVMEAPDGIAIVDQHALHERILFERFKASLEAGTLDVQRLLLPTVVDLTPVELPLALENRDLFEKLGVDVAEFGGTSVAVNSYPSILRDLTPDDIFLTILGAIKTRKGRVERADLLDFTLKQTACKAAIKAGETIGAQSIVELIAEAEEEINSHHCPHGRPSTILFSCQEIDKLFKRT